MNNVHYLSFDFDFDFDFLHIHNNDFNREGTCLLHLTRTFLAGECLLLPLHFWQQLFFLVYAALASYWGPDSLIPFLRGCYYCAAAAG